MQAVFVYILISIYILFSFRSFLFVVRFGMGYGHKQRCERSNRNEFVPRTWCLLGGNAAHPIHGMTCRLNASIRPFATLSVSATPPKTNAKQKEKKEDTTDKYKTYLRVDLKYFLTFLLLVYFGAPLPSKQFSEQVYDFRIPVAASTILDFNALGLLGPTLGLPCQRANPWI